MKIGVVGSGVVGGAIAKSYTEFAEEVRVYDVVKERRTHPLSAVLNCSDIIFLCLPTPRREGARACNLDYLEEFFRDVTTNPGNPGGLWNEANYVLRSTVPVGTTRRLAEKYRLPNLVHSPEFLTARVAAVDAQMPTRNVVGYVPTDPENPRKRVEDTLVGLYRRRFPGVPVHIMTSDESEAVKLFQNSVFAVTVAMWNELRAYADKASLDWEAVREAVLADGRISPSHTQVPGPDGKFGFGGACLPKDLANLAECMAGADLEPVLCNAALRRNERDRARNRP